IFPVVAVAGTVAVICVAESTWYAATTLLNRTPVIPTKLVPVIVTLAPAPPLAGEKPVTAGETRNTNPLVVEPAGATTATAPEVAPAGTVVAICVALLTVKLAEAPLNVTDVTPARFAPTSVTAAPVGAEGGDALVSAGEVIVSFWPVPVPSGVVTVTGALTAFAGTVALIRVGETTVKAPVRFPNLTSVVPVKFAPSIVTTCPAAALAGVSPVMNGEVTVNAPALVPEPAGVVIVTGPVLAFVGTVAEICAGESTV